MSPTTLLFLTAVLCTFLALAMDLHLAQAHYRERGINGQGALLKWLSHRRLVLGVLAIFYSAIFRIISVLLSCRLPRPSPAKVGVRKGRF